MNKLRKINLSRTSNHILPTLSSRYVEKVDQLISISSGSMQNNSMINNRNKKLKSHQNGLLQKSSNMESPRFQAQAFVLI